MDTHGADAWQPPPMIGQQPQHITHIMAPPSPEPAVKDEVGNVHVEPGRQEKRKRDTQRMSAWRKKRSPEQIKKANEANRLRMAERRNALKKDGGGGGGGEGRQKAQTEAARAGPGAEQAQAPSERAK